MKQKITLIVFFLLVVVSGMLMSQVKVNYDLEKYLPKDSEIINSLDIYRDNFGEASYAFIALNEDEVGKALVIKTELSNIENVKTVIFVDDYLNELTYSIIKASIPLEYHDSLDSLMNGYLNSGLTFPEALFNLSVNFPDQQKDEIQNLYYDYVNESHVLYQVIFSTNSADSKTETSLQEIENFLDEEGYTFRMKGDAVSAVFTKNTIAKETFLITLLIIPIIVFILVLLSKSLFDIILYAIIAGSAIIINLGTNSFFPDISYITQSMAIALQLAISLDYIIFTINSYHDSRKAGLPVEEAIKISTKKTRGPVIASALTTAVSFLALTIMKFGIGFDIGLVFTKAIIISLLTTLFLLPVLLKIFAKMIDKTKKKTKLFDFTWFAKFAKKSSKYRYYFLAVIIIIIGPLIYLQTQNEFTYGVNSFSASEGSSYSEDSIWIDNEFGQKNLYIVMVEKNDLLESELYLELNELEYVYSVTAGVYYKSIIQDPQTLAYITSNLYSENYALFQITVFSDVESEETFAQYGEIKNIVEEVGFQENHIIGETAVSYNIKEIIVKDFALVLIVAIIAIMVIIFFSFKNLLIPTILIIIIEVAVFLSMSIINLFNQDLVFLAYLIVSTILLGATIDYAILFTKTYTDERFGNNKIDSINKAAIEATPSIVTSSLLFIVSGLIISMVSSINSIAQIGLLIAIGAFISMIFVLVILPQILYILDRFIVKSRL